MNMDVLGYLYSKKAGCILDILKDNQDEILPILS